MNGKINLLSYGIVLISIIATFTDLTRGKIYNWLTAPSMLIGLILSTSLLGWEGLLHSLLGITIGFLIYGSIYLLGAIAAGDVKLLMALGAWGGWHFTVEVALLSILLGGAMAVVVLASKGRLIRFINKIYVFILSLFIKELEIYFPPVDQSLRMPFGIAMAIAAIVTLWMHPLNRLGVVFWS